MMNKEKQLTWGYPRVRIAGEGGDTAVEKIMSGSIGIIINKLQEAVREAEDQGYSNLRIEWTHMEGVPCYDIVGDRLETDEEFDRRRKVEEATEMEERALYEKLKAKYDGA